MNNGKLIIIVGISASGKTYYKNYLTEKYNLYQFQRVITRKKRNNEKNCTDIYISKKKFEYMRKNNKFFIDTKIHEDYYGYLNRDLEKVKKGINSIGDCYYKLLSELRKILKEKLVIICIQPNNIEKTKEIIKKEREDHQQRILDINEEYDFYENNKDKIDYIVYNDYSKKTDKEICKIMDKILKKDRRIYNE